MGGGLIAQISRNLKSNLPVSPKNLSSDAARREGHKKQGINRASLTLKHVAHFVIFSLPEARRTPHDTLATARYHCPPLQSQKPCLQRLEQVQKNPSLVLSARGSLLRSRNRTRGVIFGEELTHVNFTCGCCNSINSHCSFPVLFWLVLCRHP